jgi:ParB family chromosome partitioning protein
MEVQTQQPLISIRKPGTLRALPTDRGILAPVDSIEVQDGFNVREDTQPEAELVASIREQGVLNPLQVRWKDQTENRFLLIDGERRYNAACHVGLQQVPVVNRGHVSDHDALIISLAISDGQKPLSRREKAHGFQRLVDAGFNTAAIAKTMGFSERDVEETLRLMKKAVPQIRSAAMARGERSIPTRVASRAATLPRAEQTKLAPKLKGKTAKEGLEEVRKVEEKLGVTQRGPKAAKFKLVPNIERVVKDLEDAVIHFIKQDPKNKVLKGQYDLIQVLKGEREWQEIFKFTKKKNP